jgi:hypothetical protein
MNDPSLRSIRTIAARARIRRKAFPTLRLAWEHATSVA